jgi:hypothetical protein
MTDQPSQPPRRHAKIGPRGKTVARNVRYFRKSRGLSAGDLAAKTDNRLSLDAVKKIEAAVNPDATFVRRVDVDDLFVLASALGINPGVLLDPLAGCDTCHGVPPLGFTCNECGTDGTRS